MDSFYFYEIEFLTSLQLSKSIDLIVYERFIKQNTTQSVDLENLFNYSYLNIINKKLYISLIQIKKNYNFFFFSFLII